jgi:hypothetical protein
MSRSPDKETCHVSTDARVENLKRKHSTLDQELGGEEQRPNPDQAVITELKREKLKLKDAIVSLEEA